MKPQSKSKPKPKSLITHSNARKKSKVICRRWIRLTEDEAGYYPDDDGRATIYGKCSHCKGTTSRHLIHVDEGEGEGCCLYCDRDVNIVWLCHNKCKF